MAQELTGLEYLKKKEIKNMKCDMDKPYAFISYFKITPVFFRITECPSHIVMLLKPSLMLRLTYFNKLIVSKLFHLLEIDRFIGIKAPNRETG